MSEYTEYKQGFDDVSRDHWLGGYLTDTDTSQYGNMIPYAVLWYDCITNNNVNLDEYTNVFLFLSSAILFPIDLNEKYKSYQDNKPKKELRMNPTRF